MTTKTVAKKTTTKKTASNTSTTNDGFTADERAAMKERAKELRAEAKGAKDRAKGEADLLAKVAEMPDADRILAERIHSIVTENAPELMPKTWYGMPAYANAEGKVVCFFQAAAKFEARYATLGFNDSANLDDGTMWPTAFAITKLTPSQEKLIATLVKKSVA
ncbi:hypothetical protein V6K52_11675 [Knoellia sp. S7-12]|uniref:iron chaperone n=1 Tax=Knoellia sp. S7-12 TaxID=3126698 RepID=UPI0033689C20